jgi:hypothetical protein
MWDEDRKTMLRKTVQTCLIAALTMAAVAVMVTVGASHWFSTYVSISAEHEYHRSLTYSCRDGDINVAINLLPQSDDLRPGSESIPTLKGFGFRDDVQLIRTYYGGVEDRNAVARIRHVQANLPGWFAVVVLWMYPTFVLVRGPLRKFRRIRRNQCVKCAYSLTGNVSGVCPECGTKCPNVETSKSPNDEATSP